MVVNKLFWNSFTKNLAIVLVVIIVIRGVIQEFFNKKNKDLSDFVITVPSGADITNEKAKVIADRLSDAFSDGFLGLGTDEDLIESIFNSLSVPNLALVHNAFGLRNYDGSRVNNDSFLGIKTSVPQNLAYILDRELGSLDVKLRRLIAKKYNSLGVPFVA